MMGEPGTFARVTLERRMPNIVRNAIADNAYESEVVANLQGLLAELDTGQIRLLQDAAPDTAAWESYLAPILGRSWREIPWYFGESYFYRRILEATRYFQKNRSLESDPFYLPKKRGLEEALSSIIIESNPDKDKLVVLETLLVKALWGNQADLSLDPGGKARSTEIDDRPIIVNDLPEILPWFSDLRASRIQVVLDNAGAELLADLYLVDFLLTTGIAATITLHGKAHPTFVSDATSNDIASTIAAIARADNPNLQHWGQRLQSYLNDGRVQIEDDYFWTAPLMFWEMPPTLSQQLSQSDAVLIKGDANYRRLVGDFHWEMTTSFSQVTDYFPAPFIALRTLKSEIAIGLSQAQIEATSQKDTQWLTSGRWGLIQARLSLKER